MSLIKTKTTTITAYQFFYDTGLIETVYLTKQEFAGFKRSVKKKKVLSIKKILELQTTIKTKIF